MVIVKNHNHNCTSIRYLSPYEFEKQETPQTLCPSMRPAGGGALKSKDL